MRKSDEEKVKRVRSAKAWLEKAEESFGKQSDVRGELNLMLAEAEMKQMRKKERHSRGLRKIAAAGTAAVIALACWQLTGWEKTTTVRPLPAPAPAALQEEKAKPPESVPATPGSSATGTRAASRYRARQCSLAGHSTCCTTSGRTTA